MFSMPTFEPDGSGSMKQNRRDTIIYLDGTNGTSYHFQRYAGKEGWIYKSHANLDLKNEEHRLIEGYINALGSAIRAHTESLGIVAKAEARAKAKQPNGE